MPRFALPSVFAPRQTEPPCRHAATRHTLLAAAASHPARGDARAAEPIVAGVSGPLTGPNAQYGGEWKRGFDLALDGINESGGVMA